MEIQKALQILATFALLLLPAPAFAQNKFDGNWTTHMACEEATKGTGERNEGAGVLGRRCTFEFEKQPDTPPAAEH